MFLDNKLYIPTVISLKNGTVFGEQHSKPCPPDARQSLTKAISKSDLLILESTAPNNAWKGMTTQSVSLVAEQEARGQGKNILDLQKSMSDAYPSYEALWREAGCVTTHAESITMMIYTAIDSTITTIAAKNLNINAPGELENNILRSAMSASGVADKFKSKTATREDFDLVTQIKEITHAKVLRALSDPSYGRRLEDLLVEFSKVNSRVRDIYYHQVIKSASQKFSNITVVMGDNHSDAAVKALSGFPLGGGTIPLEAKTFLANGLSFLQI